MKKTYEAPEVTKVEFDERITENTAAETIMMGC